MHVFRRIGVSRHSGHVWQAVFLVMAMSIASVPQQSSLAQEADTQAQIVALKQAAGDRFKIGVGLSEDVLADRGNSELIVKHFSIVTPENCMKPQGIQPLEGEFQFDKTDEFIALAKAKSLEVVGHCLVWAKDDRTDAWMTVDGNRPVSSTKLLQRLETHIATVVGRYNETVTMWDVVNEALADDGQDYLRDSIYTRLTGDRFIVKSFQVARQHAPHALLIYNDYNCFKPEKRKKLIRLLESLIEQGAPIDAFGMQGHFELDDVPIADLRTMFEAIRDLNLKIVVSELDIDVVKRGRWWAENGKFRDELKAYDPYHDHCPTEILKRQAEQYAQLFELFTEFSDSIERVSFWNLHDGHSWLNYFPWDRVNHPLLFDRNQQPKPAFFSVVHALQAHQ
jgi:endo-1,4-beta-xylanase